MPTILEKPENPLLVQARKSLDERKFDECLDMYSTLLKSQ